MERHACVYLCVALAASLGLGLAIAYLEVRRSQEIVQLELRWFRDVQRLQREIDLLKEDLNNRTTKINELIGSMETPRGQTDEDYYYDEEYEDEEGGDEEGKREKREIGRLSPALAPYNLILRQGLKTHPNRTAPLEVKAKIIVHPENGEQEGYEIEPETHDKPQKVSSLGSGVAVHFWGDTSRIRHSSRNHCYNEFTYALQLTVFRFPSFTHRGKSKHVNHRMCHVEGIFRDWSPTHWSDRIDNTFTMRDGHLTLHRSPGIYYLYVQIFYADNHDTNGYRVYVNGEPRFQCTVTGLHDHRWIPSRVPYKKNSCYTGGLVQLNEGDRLSIREIDNSERYSVFEPYKSYFGLFKVINLPSNKSRRR